MWVCQGWLMGGTPWGPISREPGVAARHFHTSCARLQHTPCGIPAGTRVPSCQHHP